MQVVVARQEFPQDGVTPAIKLPAAAVVVRMKKPEETARIFKITFQSAVGFLNVVGGMNGIDPLDLNSEKVGDALVVSSDYLPPPRTQAAKRSGAALQRLADGRVRGRPVHPGQHQAAGAGVGRARPARTRPPAAAEHQHARWCWTAQVAPAGAGRQPRPADRPEHAGKGARPGRGREGDRPRARGAASTSKRSSLELTVDDAEPGTVARSSRWRPAQVTRSSCHAATLADLSPDEAWLPFEPSAAQPFDRRLAAHLYRRAGFAASSRELDEAVKLGPQATVKQLLAAGEQSRGVRRGNAEVRPGHAGREQSASCWPAGGCTACGTRRRRWSRR